jgi:polyribonucleotide 5'-hydroxyl-kinase
MSSRVLKAESELRCEVSEGEVLGVKLVKGACELFGIELFLNKEYSFHDESIALFTWYGCTLEISGNCSHEKLYESDKTPMVSYVNTHMQLEAKRDVALANGDNGPRVLIVGPNDSCKSTTARILTAYAARLDRSPMYVDLDAPQGLVGFPGCIAAVPVEKTGINIDDGFSTFMPLLYYLGNTSITTSNIDLYKSLVTLLANKIQQRLDNDADSRASGIIMNTMGWSDNSGYEILLQCINHYVSVFSVDVVLVMGHDRLYSSLTSTFGSTGNVTVVNLPHSGGVVKRDADTRRRVVRNRIKEYFYGPYRLRSTITTLSPHRQDLRLSSLNMYRIGGFQLSEGMRLIGDSSSSNDTALTKLVPSLDLKNSIAAVLHASSEESEQESLLEHSNVAGFIWIAHIDLEQDTITTLLPCPGLLPNNISLVVGAMRYID